MESLKTVILFLLILSTYRIFAQSEKDTISNVYQLGEVVIISKSEKEKIDQKQMQSLNKKDVAETLGILPSITINNVGSRNESAVYLRGFDIRSVPIYMDGIPIYIPYDGYVDLAIYHCGYFKNRSIKRIFFHSLWTQCFGRNHQYD